MLKDDLEEKPFDRDAPETAPFGACCICGRGAWSMLHTSEGRAALCCYPDCGGHPDLCGTEENRAAVIQRLQSKRPDCNIGPLKAAHTQAAP